MLTFTASALRIKAYDAIKLNLNVVSCRNSLNSVRQLRLFWVHWAWLQAPPIAPLVASRLQAQRAGLCRLQPIEPPCI